MPVRRRRLPAVLQTAGWGFGAVGFTPATTITRGEAGHAGQAPGDPQDPTGTPVVLRALVADVDEARLRRRPAPGEWAIIEVVDHLADTEERALGRARHMLAEDDPVLEPFDQEALAEERRYLDLDLNEELARLEQLRRDHLTVLEALDRPGWERTGRHGEHGELTVELYETHVAAEEVDHLAQSPGSSRPPQEAPRAAGAVRRATCPSIVINVR